MERPEALPEDPAERAVVSARARRAEAVSELAAAEAEGEQREREVEQLERYIEDLKARGEDPTKHAEEGLALFQPGVRELQEDGGADRAGAG